MKKQSQLSFAEELNKGSDTELIDKLNECSNDRTIAVIEALLNKRLKRSLQFLTEVIQKNNKKTTKYNLILAILTIIMTVATIMNIIVLFHSK